MHIKNRKLIVFYIVIALIFFLVGCSQSEGKEPSNNATLADEQKNQTVVVTEQAPQPKEEVQEKKVEGPTPVYNEYNVVLNIDPENRIVNGVEKIKFKNTTGDEMSKIYINTYFNAFCNNNYMPFFSSYEKKVYKYGKDMGYFNIKSVTVNNEDLSFELDDTLLTVELNKIVSNDTMCEVTIIFESYIPKISHRTGANDYAMWFGNYLPTLAVNGKDGPITNTYYKAGEPSVTDIANFNVTVVTPKEYTVVCTGVGIATETNEAKTYVASAKMVRDFAFSLSKHYKVQSLETDDGVTIKYYYYSDDVYDTERFMEVAGKSMKYYNETIAAYPYLELDIVECELFFESGMEYPQFIMIDERKLKSQNSLQCLTHEIAHQWFYNIVGNDQVSEAWLDEGLSLMMEQELLNSEVQISEKMKSLYRNLDAKIKLGLDSRMSQSLKGFDTWSDYYQTNYVRALLMFNSLENKMGKEKFNEFIRLYFSENAFKIATREKIISAAESVYGEGLEDFFKSWIDNKKLPELINRDN